MRKGLMNLPTNIIGYVIVLAIFIGIMIVISLFWFNIQTIPRESTDKVTACDLAYTLSLWGEATVYPNIFNKTFLEIYWNEESIEKTANSIFENMSDELFISDSDYFIHLSDGENIYSMYVPPESKAVYDSCAGAKVSAADYKLISQAGLEEVIAGSGNLEVIEGSPKELPKNQLYSLCPATTFVADKEEVEIGLMVAGLTTNIATLMRDGIYKVGAKGSERMIYDLGSYPEGCYVDKGQMKTEEKAPFKKVIESPVIDLLSWIFLIRPLLDFTDVAWTTVNKYYALCGFNWDWDETTRVLSVDSSGLSGGECSLVTKIPLNIVNESNLSSKICRPKEIIAPVWFPEGSSWSILNQQKKHFYLVIEDAKQGYENEKEYCKFQCEEDKHCISYCDNSRLLEPSLCNLILSAREKRSCYIAQLATKTFLELPKGAVDIKYYVTDEKYFVDNKNFEDLTPEEYSVYSACGTWPSVYECGSANDCDYSPCVYAGIEEELEGHEGEFQSIGGCTGCLDASEGFLCSPSYLDAPPSIDDALYTCQNVYNLAWPKQEKMSECLPYLVVEKTLNGKKLEGEVDCSNSDNLDSEVTWKIDASLLCSSEYLTDDAGNRIISKLPEFCPLIKIWPNINSSQVKVISKDTPIVEITQKVCRKNYPFNEANKAFIVANYQLEEKTIQYSIDDSIVGLKGGGVISSTGGEGIVPCQCVNIFGTEVCYPPGCTKT